MTLTTHALVGAFAAELVPQHPVLGFFLGFASHLLIDSLPHFDYSIASAVPNPERDISKGDIQVSWKFVGDLFPVGLDGTAGLAISAAIFSATPHGMFIALLGGFAGILPDALQFVYFKVRREPLISLQKFHSRLQENNFFETRPLPGLGIQFALIFALGIVLKLAGRF